jgi:hypothetical protein
MDTSKEYIEMCEKAQEIQELRYNGYEWGDYYFYYNYYDVCIQTPENYIEVSTSKGITELVIRKDNHVWLPRQDQLQEMLIHKYISFDYPLFAMVEDLYNQENDMFDSEPENQRSLEKAWLILLMCEKYDKSWNPENKEWEKL